MRGTGHALDCLVSTIQLSRCLMIVFVTELALACDKLEVSGVNYHKDVQGTYRREGGRTCHMLQTYTHSSGGYYIFYANKPTQVRGGWVIGDVRCGSYDRAKVISVSDPKDEVQNVKTWSEEFPFERGWVKNKFVKVECKDPTGLTDAAIVSLSVCLILLAVFILMLLITIKRWKHRKRRRRQHLESLRTIPSISYRVSAQPERDLPPSYDSVASPGESEKNQLPSYQEVVDNPEYVQIHSPLSRNGVGNPAFDFGSCDSSASNISASDDGRPQSITVTLV